MKDLLRNYLLYRHFAPVKAELIIRGGSDEKAEQAGNSDAVVNSFPFDIWRLTAHEGAFVFPDDGENDADNE